jgi:hypothetical protein
MIGTRVDFMKVRNPLPVFTQPGEYFLDNMQIAVSPHEEEPSLRRLYVETFTTPDSFSLFLPYVAEHQSVRLRAAVSVSGEIQDAILEYDAVESDTAMLKRIERLRDSRIFLKDSTGRVDIQIN